LGLQAASAAAAVRAGIIALGEHPFMVDGVGDLMPSALDPQLDSRLSGPERLLALAESALREALAPLSVPRLPQLRLPVYLGLPELRPGFTAQDAETVRAGLARFKGLQAEFSRITILTEGHAAGLSALAMANGQLQQGAFEACLVGGVDSYFHPDTMEWLDSNRQLVGSVSRSGFIPGEGAGFCLLLNEPTRHRLGLKALARVLSVAVGNEAK
jgi:3-oxoacyl-[acyl-carrier-protein] synthase-1